MLGAKPCLFKDMYTLAWALVGAPRKARRTGDVFVPAAANAWAALCVGLAYVLVALAIALGELDPIGRDVLARLRWRSHNTTHRGEASAVRARGPAQQQAAPELQGGRAVVPMTRLA